MPAFMLRASMLLVLCMPVCWLSFSLPLPLNVMVKLAKYELHVVLDKKPELSIILVRKPEPNVILDKKNLNQVSFST